MRQLHKCNACNIDNIKLYRPYGEFLRDERIFCEEHVPVDEWDWFVPMIEDVDGTVWGYTSVPQNDIRKWESLPPEDVVWKNRVVHLNGD